MDGEGKDNKVEQSVKYWEEGVRDVSWMSGLKFSFRIEEVYFFFFDFGNDDI